MANQDIIISPASIYYSATATGLPSENSIDYGEAWGGGWTSVGVTLTPLVINYSRELFELEIEQATAPIRAIITKENVGAETTLGEMTAANLVLAFGGTSTPTAAGPAQVAKEELKAGGTVTLPIYQWGFEGLYQTDAGDEYPLRIFFYRGSAALNGNLQFSKKAAAGIPLRIVGYVDTTKTVGEQIILIQKVTGPMTTT